MYERAHFLNSRRQKNLRQQDQVAEVLFSWRIAGSAGRIGIAGLWEELTRIESDANDRIVRL